MTDDTRPDFTAAAELAEWGGWPALQELGEAADPFEVSAAGIAWRPKDRHVGVHLAGRLVAHAGFVVAPVEVGGRRFEVAGIGGVLVSPRWRGHGLARAVVGAALDAARADGLRFGLLFCLPDWAPLYARLGWTPLPGPVTADQPDGPAPVPLGAMWIGLAPGARWPEGGAVRLHSLPF
ncbi:MULTISPECIES: GNAT family N-acetyltransferase [Kitasatospora]|uniref:Putative acetyltransferase n=1 Tax=Kitasatospora setae (strain ATCC 33774 / DSM 43861 / JCM 3304 / KCC A-0304 / NBRC 14216 / KM-6054) TaxID=452652 RepID=E4N6D0_KITSK|nr:MULTISPECIES: GNAT family N-acetyltransferase [Kitasatospora]BAJ26761.1 putative acetyltransferase [Kitasatospora setae KM-6054]